MQKLLIFDMDGALVDVTGSYRQAVMETVKHFTNADITHQEIQARKNRGGANNDWDLTLEMICERGGSPSRQEVIVAFQRIYLGDNCNGLIHYERWLAGDGLLQRLSKRWRLALFTGRMRWEALYTLHRFAPQAVFDPMVCMEDVAREKPDPDGLINILRAVEPLQAYYIGDTMDDCRAAQRAAVPFIGVAGPENPLREELRARFQREGAVAVISDLNELERRLA
ncbi:MAG: HAD family hydrolase [Acidobacteria bacterium]|nr:HAD family hydrolase [Acidobacteriota bacterium]